MWLIDHTERYCADLAIGIRLYLMLSELALVDWVALLIAVVLLGVAAVASYLSHSNSGPAVIHGSGSTDSAERTPPPAAPPRYSPSHAVPASASQSDAAMSVTDVAATPHVTPKAPAHAAPVSGQVHSSVPKQAPVLSTAPAPPILKRSSAPEGLDLTDATLAKRAITHSDRVGTGETIARRAARLRSRPVSEPEAKVRSEIKVREIKVVDEDAPELVFANATNKLSTGMDSAEGFAKRSPGFFSDPIGRHQLRYWNGSSWTEYVKEGAERFIDPL